MNSLKPIKKIFVEFGLWMALYFGSMSTLRSFLNINHIDRFYILICFLIAINILLLFFNKQLKCALFSSFDRVSVSCLCLLFTTISIVYYYINPDISSLIPYKNVHFAYFRYEYVLSKSFDILFQQLAFSMCVYNLIDAKIKLLNIQIIMSLILLSFHIFTLFTLPQFVSIGFIISSALAGWIWPIILTKSKHGIIYNYILHWTFYIIAALLFNFLVIG